MSSAYPLLLAFWGLNGILQVSHQYRTASCVVPVLHATYTRALARPGSPDGHISSVYTALREKVEGQIRAQGYRVLS